MLKKFSLIILAASLFFTHCRGDDPGDGDGGDWTSGDRDADADSDSDSDSDSDADADPSCTPPSDISPDFSFFAASWEGLTEVSGSIYGFGGNLGGLAGADQICKDVAARVCRSGLNWRAFLSTSTEDAIDRIGSGPWYDYHGALVADDVSGLANNERPAGGNHETFMVDEIGRRHDGATLDADGANGVDDDHDVLTGSNADGRFSGDSCNDWTGTDAGRPTCGHLWPRDGDRAANWINGHGNCSGCAPGIDATLGGGEQGTVGSGGGYGAIYCFVAN